MHSNSRVIYFTAVKAKEPSCFVVIPPESCQSSPHWGNHSAKWSSKANISHCVSGTWWEGDQEESSWQASRGTGRCQCLILIMTNWLSQKLGPGCVTGKQREDNLHLNVQNGVKYNLACFWGVGRNYKLAEGIRTCGTTQQCLLSSPGNLDLLPPSCFSEKVHGVPNVSKMFTRRP